MPITYYTDMPEAADQPSQSQPQIKQNFNAINQIIDVNHYTFNSSVVGQDPGKHKFLQMPRQAVAPTTVAQELGVYTKLEALFTNADQLYIRRPSNGVEIPSTQYTNNIANGNLSKGYTYLPSGLLIKWGYRAANFAGALPQSVNIDIDDAGNFPTYNATPLLAFLTPYSGVNPDPNLMVYIESIPGVSTVTTRWVNRSGGAAATGYAVGWLTIGLGV